MSILRADEKEHKKNYNYTAHMQQRPTLWMVMCRQKEKKNIKMQTWKCLDAQSINIMKKMPWWNRCWKLCYCTEGELSTALLKSINYHIVGAFNIFILNYQFSHTQNFMSITIKALFHLPLITRHSSNLLNWKLTLMIVDRIPQAWVRAQASKKKVEFNFSHQIFCHLSSSQVEGLPCYTHYASAG